MYFSSSVFDFSEQKCKLVCVMQMEDIKQTFFEDINILHYRFKA